MSSFLHDLKSIMYKRQKFFRRTLLHPNGSEKNRLPKNSTNRVGFLKVALVAALALSTPSQITSLSSDKPEEFSLDKVTFESPPPNSSEKDYFAPPSLEKPVLGVNVNIDNVIPYLTRSSKSLSFVPLCEGLTSGNSECGEAVFCPTPEVCANKFEYLASRVVRVAKMWNETLKYQNEKNTPPPAQQQQPQVANFVIDLSKFTSYRGAISKFVAKKRSENPKYSVLDVGGLGDTWSWPITNATLDFTLPPKDLPPKIIAFQGDIT